jgi:hypothetical protein
MKQEAAAPATHWPFRPVLEKIVILIRRAQRPQWQGSRAARYSINNGQAADAANEAAPPLGKVTSISRVGLVHRTVIPTSKVRSAPRDSMLGSEWDPPPFSKPHFPSTGSLHDCHAKNFHSPPSFRHTARYDSTASIGPFADTACTRARPVMSATPGAGNVNFRSS